MNQETAFDVIVIGAGLTGLTTAFLLRQQGKKVLVLEKAHRAGGVIQTIEEDGFVFETGPNTGVISHPEVLELFEALGDSCALETADPSAKCRLIWKGKRWNALPAGLFSAIGTPLFTWKDKFRILGEPWRPKGSNPDESIAELVVRRLGQSYLDYAVDPFISGVYAGNPQTLITRYALPRLYRLEQTYGSFIGGAWKMHRDKIRERKKQGLPVSSGKHHPTKEVFSARNGLMSLIRALEEAVGAENIRLQASPVKVIPDGGEFLVTAGFNQEKSYFQAKKVISTVSPHSFQELFPFLSDTDLEPFRQLNYAPVVLGILGFKKWQGRSLKAFGGLIPSREQKNMLGVLFTSSFFKERAPQNGALLSVFMGGMRKPGMIEKSNDELLSMISRELPAMMRVKNWKPDLVRIYRYPHAIPQYEISSGKRFEMIEQIQNQYPGLYLAGNIRNGIGMADRILQAYDLAREIGNEQAAS